MSKRFLAAALIVAMPFVGVMPASAQMEDYTDYSDDPAGVPIKKTPGDIDQCLDEYCNDTKGKDQITCTKVTGDDGKPIWQLSCGDAVICQFKCAPRLIDNFVDKIEAVDATNGDDYIIKVIK